MNPALFVVSGSNDFLRRRQVAQTVAHQRQRGWDIQVVDGGDTTDFMAALNQSANVFGGGQPVLLVVENPDKVPLPILEEHARNPDPQAVLLLHLEGDPKGNTKFGKFVAGLDKKAHQAFPMPEKKWEWPQAAAAFCVAEAKRKGKDLPETLAAGLVRLSGTDFGFLSFEIQKAITYVEARGATEIKAEDLRVVRAAIGEVTFDGVKDALISRSRKSAATALDRVKRSMKEPVMPLCGYLEAIVVGSKVEREGRTSYGWLHLATLMSRGIDMDQIAGMLGINPWRCKNYVLPEVRLWDPQSIMGLLRGVVTTRRALLSGQSDPWVILVSRVLDVCR